MKSALQKILNVYWLHYSRYIYHSMIVTTRLDEGDVRYWRELSFVKIITYLLPISLAAILFRMIMQIIDGQEFIALFELCTYAILCSTMLFKKLSLPYKKVIFIVIIYFFCITLLLMQDLAGPGTLYLTCTCIYTAFLFRGNKIYYSLAANLIIVLSIDLVIYFHLFPTPLLQHFNAISWLSYTSNLLFINLLFLVLIQRVIKRLEKIIIRESELQGQLLDEALEIIVLNNKLKESEDYYRYLFAANPVPMWVFDNSNLHFMQVNDAAIKAYGYTREEFMKMTVLELIPKSEHQGILKIVKAHKKSERAFKGMMMHLKKNKRTFPVEVRSNQIEVNGKVGRLVLATDITEHARYIQNIENQNKRLKYIAWIQSHKVRAPLARVMSLSDLLSRDHDDNEKADILKYLMISADELNNIINMIIKQAE